MLFCTKTNYIIILHIWYGFAIYIIFNLIITIYKSNKVTFSNFNSIISRYCSS